MKEPSDQWPQMRVLLALWLVSGVLFVAGLGISPVRRTQEARVLEGAREMLGQDFQGWMIPHLNGQIRLQKPPLAYWLSALSFHLFGVGEWAGRLPAAISGWLTVGLTASFASRLFNRRAALFAAAALFGSSLFFQHMRLAETDSLALLFVTAAIYAFARATRVGNLGRSHAGTESVPIDPRSTEVSSPTSRVSPQPKSDALWFHAASVMVGAAALSKGPLALFPLLFFLALVCIHKRWHLMRRWVRSGAPVTLALVAVPWFAYVATTREFRVLGKEIGDVVGGEDHGQSFLIYIPLIAVALAPWSAFALGAFVETVRRALRDERFRTLLIWSGAVLLPLCVLGNKQVHYLLPLLPPLMIMVGWLLDQALQYSEARNAEAHRMAKIVRICLTLTLAVTFIAGFGVIVAAWMIVKRVHAEDVVLGVAICGLVLMTLWLIRFRRFQSATIAYAAGCGVLLSFLVSVWLPSLHSSDTRQLAAALNARFGIAPYCFLGDGPYLPLNFSMQRVIPAFSDPRKILAYQQKMPGLVVLEHLIPKSKSVSLPPMFVHDSDIGDNDQRFRVFQLPASQLTPTTGAMKE